MGVHARYRLRALLVPARLPRGRAVVRSGRQSAGQPGLAEIARGDHARSRRRSSVVQADVERDSRIGRGGLAAAVRRAKPVAAEGARRARCDPAPAGRISPADGAALYVLASADASEGRSRDPGRSERDAVQTHAGRRRRAVADITALAAPAGTRSGAAATARMIDLLAVGAAALGAIVGSFLNVCIY